MSGAPMRFRLRWLRHRLACRPDTEHEMTLNRIVIVGLALTYLWASHALGFAEATAALEYGQALCIAYLCASVVLFAHIVWRPGVSHPRRHVALVLDMTTLSLGMHFGDSAFALGYPIYLWIIFGNGFRFGVRYLFTAAAVAIVGFLAVILTTPIWLRDRDLGYGLLLGLVILPAYVASLIRKLSEAKQQAETANKAKSLFLASVSHELRTPLNAIITLSDLLKIAQPEREQREMASTIGDSGRSLLRLINEILDLSRIEAGNQPVKIAEFELVDCLARMRRVLGVQAARKGLDLKVFVGPNVPSRINGPEQELEQILTNLVGNAIKFTQSGGVTVAINLASRETDRGGDETPVTGETLVFAVRDTGIGIAPDALGRIFERFTQADDTIIDRFGGTGLGLAIVRQLVERHGGAIDVESEPGQGSVFTFTMPVTRGVATELDFTSLGAIVVTHSPLMPLLVGQFGARVQRVQNASGLAAALANWSDPQRDPIVLLDLDTLGRATLGNLVAVLSEAGTPVIAGFVSNEGGSWPRETSLPVALAIPMPVSMEDWGKLARAAMKPADMPTFDVASAEGGRGRSLRILVAEDNLTNQAVARKILEREGHEVTVAADGEKAVELLEKVSFDLVLMDINMPVMNGFEATKLHRFAALGRRRIPIYALTADVTPETRLRCDEAGMDGCLHKPIEMDELSALLRRVAGEPVAGGAASASGSTTVPSSSNADEAIDFTQVPIIDPAALANLEGLGGLDFLAELVAQFGKDARRHVEALAAATADCDPQAFRETAHSLRSSAANVGAKRIFAMCLDWRAATLEQLAGEGEAWIARLHETLIETEGAISALLADRRRAGRAA